jgi:glutamine synthetase
LRTYWFTELGGAFLAVEERLPSQCGTSPLTIAGSGNDGWQRKGSTDLLLVPEAVPFDPLGAYRFCDVAELNGPFNRCPRHVMKRLVARLEQMNIRVLVGAELEFHLFDSVSLQTSFYNSEFRIAGRDGSVAEGPPHRMTSETGRYRRLANDRFAQCRTACVAALACHGISVRSHSHESGFCQNEIALDPIGIARIGDTLQVAKQAIRDVAADHGFTPTFAPKPLANDYGNSMHLNVSVWQGESNLFFEGPHQLSQAALRFANGVLYHVRALNALLNPTTNSYARLLSTFNYKTPPRMEERNRLAVARVPPFFAADAARIEFRMPDAHANPYLAISALILAGLEGMALDDDALASNAASNRPARMCHSLFEAAESLERGGDFLVRDGVFDADLVRTLADLAFSRHLTISRYPNPAEMHSLF